MKVIPLITSGKRAGGWDCDGGREDGEKIDELQLYSGGRDKTS